MSDSVFFLIGLLVGLVFGWIYTNHEVAADCIKLESFYMGNKVFDCKMRK